MNKEDGSENRHSVRALGCMLMTIMLVMLPQVAAAQLETHPARFEFRIGGQLFSSFTSAIRLDSETHGIGTQFRLERDVDLDARVSVARADGLYRFNSRHHVAFAFYDIERTGTRELSRDIQFGDETFRIATTVSTVLEEQVGKVSYGYTALIRPRATLGPSFGLHVMKLGAGLALASQPLLEDAGTTAPLPVLGVRGSYRFAERWRLQGMLEWFDVQAGDVDGVFSDFILTIEHDTFDRFGFGFGINNNNLDIESGDADFRGTIDLSFRSAVAYFKGSFGVRQ